MRTPYAIVFISTLVIAGIYVYTAAEAVCKTPITYRIGNIDNRFDITEDDARIAIADAESIWEGATGRNLFTYAEDGDVVVSFVFDERQEFAEAEIDFREQLNEAEHINEEVKGQYNTFVAEYDRLEADYRARVVAYEARLEEYNETVQRYNSEGGAPPEVYSELQDERSALDDELASLQLQGATLNTLVDQINALSDEGNKLVEEYNESVSSYNERFGESREFTQGDYQNRDINIYKFTDTDELKLVLLHELGHALSLGHVEGESSIMYHLLGGQPNSMEPSAADLAEFERVCGYSTQSFIERLKIRFHI